MVLGFNNFGLLGDKDQTAEKVNALFQKLGEYRKVNLTTTNATPVVAHQVFLPPAVAGVYLFRVCATRFNQTDSAGAAYVGNVTVTVNNAGDVTVVNGVANMLLGIKNTSDGSAATAVTAVAQDAPGTPAVNFVVTGQASKTIFWNVAVNVESYCADNPHQSPTGNKKAAFVA